MAARYWRGGTGTWNGTSTTNWSTTSNGAGGASVPTISDDVYFNLATTYTVTLQTTSTDLNCRSFNHTAGTVTFTSASSSTSYKLNINGFGFTTTATGTWVAGAIGAGEIVITGTGSGSINTNGKTLTVTQLAFRNSGVQTLNSALTLNTAANANFQVGTLNLNGFTFTTGAFRSDGGDVNTTTRTLTLGNANIVLTGTQSGYTALYAPQASGLTISNNGGGFIATGSTTRSFNMGGTSAPAGVHGLTTRPNITLSNSPALTGPTAVAVVGYWANVDLGSMVANLGSTSLQGGVNNLICSAGTNFKTNSVSPIFQGTSCNVTTNGCAWYQLSVQSTSQTINLLDAIDSRLISHGVGTLNTNGFNVTCLQFSTGGSLSPMTLNTGNSNIYVSYDAAASPSSPSALVACNTTANLTVTGSLNIFVNLSSSTNQQVIHWGNASANFANPNLFPNITFTGSNTMTYNSTPVIANFGMFRNVDWGTVTSAQPAINWQVMGNVTLSSTSTYTNTNLSIYRDVLTNATSYLNTNNRTLLVLNIGNYTAGAQAYSNAIVSFSSAVTVSSNFALQNGTLYLNDMVLTCNKLILTGSVATAYYRNISFGNGYIAVNNGTANSTVIEATNLSSFSYTGSGNILVTGTNSHLYILGNSSTPTDNSALNVYHTSAPNSSANISNNSYFGVLSFANSNTYPNAATTISVQSIVLPSLGANQWTNLSITTFGATNGSITTNGKTIGNVTINNTANTSLFSSTVTVSGTTTLTQGNLNLGTNTLSTFDFSSGAVAGANRSITGTGNANITNSWIVSNGTNFTGNTYKINMSNASAKTFDGAGGSYGNLIQATTGTLTIAGNNQFNDISVISAGIPSTIRFTAATTQTLENFTLSGTSGSLVTINSVTVGTQFNLLKTSGTVNVNYLNITDSNVRSAFFANTNSTNSGNNAGWNFTTPAVVQAGFSVF